ncbi:MAG: sulfurtransferase-like selenium metabolism protein YedF [Desulfuromonadales bacterium]|nr:sulfurtransferase-like selenium metabolism protein YedF [Desulfuromonadales bacterium]
MEILDCRAFQCPHPVVEVRKHLLAHPGQPLKVLVADEIARENVTRLAENQGYQVSENSSEGGYALELTPAGETVTLAPELPVSGKTVVFVASDAMGNGSDELGRLLMKNFLFTLTELVSPPDILLFVNAGVKLTSAGSDALEALEKLACLGADIASCGLCLDYFHLKDQLAIGRVSNMLAIAETLRQAGRTIRP